MRLVIETEIKAFNLGLCRYSLSFDCQGFWWHLKLGIYDVWNCELQEEEEEADLRYSGYFESMQLLTGLFWFTHPNFNWKTRWLKSLDYFQALSELSPHTPWK